jgi:hypothetical protein
VIHVAAPHKSAVRRQRRVFYPNCAEWFGPTELLYMPEQETLKRAREDEREGKAPSTQVGEFVREEMHHIREGKHGARSPQQAIAIGLSKARRAGVKLRPPARGRARSRTRREAQRNYAKGQSRVSRLENAVDAVLCLRTPMGRLSSGPRCFWLFSPIFNRASDEA